MNSHPIFACATSLERSALHVLRISGNGCSKLLMPSLFIPKSAHKNFSGAEPHSRFPYARYLEIRNSSGKTLDDCMVVFFQSPASYSGEETIEITTHGNILITHSIMSHLRSLGFQDAKPGEFTQRAFLNGKLDLTQAEAVNQIIHSDTYAGIELAREVNSGILAKHTGTLKNDITTVLSYLEAHIDFGQDDVGEFNSDDFLPQLLSLELKLKTLSNSYEAGLKLREGVRLAIVGSPNAGKSSLYNALLGSERAIVTSIAGTTRDILEDRLIIKGCDYVLLDTAGLRLTSDEVEKIGIERAKEAVNTAHVICLVIDSTFLAGNLESIKNHIWNEISFIGKSFFDNKPLIIAFSKSDIHENISDKQKSEIARIFDGSSCISFNRLELDELKNTLVNIHKSLGTEIRAATAGAILISQRQKDKSLKALNAVNDAVNLVNTKDFPEKIASVLNYAKDQLEEIVGEISLDSVLDSVFSSFCIGK